MFWKNKEKNDAKLAGPRDLPDLVKKYLESTHTIDRATIPFLKAVLKPVADELKVWEIRIFDPSEAEASDIKIQDFGTLNEKPEMVIAEGKLDENAKKVDLAVKKTYSQFKFLTYDEILKQIEDLKEPGSSVFFYTNAGIGAGGPLGRGAALIRVREPVNGKKIKKYGIYGVSIVNMQPTKNESLVFETDKVKDIANWVSESHKPRFC